LHTFTVGDVILDKYEVTGTLGKGGMGFVLAAWHRELHARVALKFLLPALRDKPELCSRFAREARTLIFERHAQDKPLWVTTGLTRPQLAERYGAGIVRRIFERARIVALGAPAAK
jgi:serine/threonine protein kinase